MFFLIDPPTTETYTLSLHDALPICLPAGCGQTPSGRSQRRLSARELSAGDRKSTRLNSSHLGISYAVFCLKKKRNRKHTSSPGPYSSPSTERRPSHLPAARFSLLSR